MAASNRRYVALLRGVSPTNAKMVELRECFEAAGYTNVATVLGSGNVVFDAKRAAVPTLERAVEAAMKARLAHPFPAIVRGLDDLGELLAADPYARARLPKNAKRVVTFLRAAPKGDVAGLPLVQDGATILAVRGAEVLSAYVPSPKGPVFMRLVERTFGKDVTTRTWETVQKIAARAASLALPVALLGVAACGGGEAAPAPATPAARSGVTWAGAPAGPAPLRPEAMAPAARSAAPPARATNATSGDPYAAARRACVDATNAYRARVGAAPLVARDDKRACTDQDARGDAQRGTVHGSSGQCGYGAQNECPGWPGPAGGMVAGCLKSMFDEGPGEPYSEHGHFLNMTSAAYRGVACGFHEQGGRVWLVQNFFR